MSHRGPELHNPHTVCRLQLIKDLYAAHVLDTKLLSPWSLNENVLV